MSKPERRNGSRHGSCALRILMRGGMLIGVLVAVLQTVLLGPLLPDAIVSRVAWDGSGRAWTGTSTFLTIHLVVVAASVAVFIGIPLLLRIAAWWHGTAEVDTERVARLIEFEQWTLLFGLVTTTFTIAGVQSLAVANLARPPHLDGSFTMLLAAYLAFTATWTVQVVRRFRRTRDPLPATAVA